MTTEDVDKMVERWRERRINNPQEPSKPSIAERADVLIKMGRKPTVPEVLPLINEYYEKDGNCAGGTLHVVLDDGNIETIFVKHAVEYARENNDEDGEKLGELLLKMSYTQRYKLYTRHS